MKRIIVFISVLSLFLLASCTEPSHSQNSDIQETASVQENPVDSKTEISEEKSDIESSIESEQSDAPLLLESNTQKISKIEFDLPYKNKAFATLSDCVGHSSISEVIESITGDNQDLNTKNSVFVEDDTKLVFQRQVMEHLEYPSSFIKTNESALELQSSRFISLARVLQSCIDQDGITVVVRYLDDTGNTLFETEFDPEAAPASSTEPSDDPNSGSTETSDQSGTTNQDTSDNSDTSINSSVNSPSENQ